MRVVMHSNYASIHGAASPGQTIRLPDDVATDLIRKGYASKVGDDGRSRTPNPTETADTPPDGTVDEVLAWVDGDPDRAAAALEAERQRSRPRKSIIEVCEQLTADSGDSGDSGEE